MKGISIIILALAISLIMPARSALAYGNGNGNGNGDTAEDHEHASGGVSWQPNPNGDGVIGSSLWRGPRPAGPFEEGKSIQDALEELARGLGSEFSEEDARKNMEWAKRTGILRGIKVPPELARLLKKGSPQASSVKPASAPQKTPTPQDLRQARRAARRAKREAEAIDVVFDTLDFIKKKKKQGNPATAPEIDAHVKKKIIKQQTKGVVDLDKPEETVVKLADKAREAIKSYFKK
jgi:hypothetical protein